MTEVASSFSDSAVIPYTRPISLELRSKAALAHVQAGAGLDAVPDDLIVESIARGLE